MIVADTIQAGKKMERNIIHILDNFAYGTAPYLKEQNKNINEPVYEQADQILTEIIRSGDAFQKEYIKNETAYSEDIRFSTKLLMRGNNTLLFCGSRGSGKTTILHNYLDRISNGKNAGEIDRHSLMILDTALPENIGTKHIIRLVIGGIMSQMKFLVENHKDRFRTGKYSMQEARAEILDLTRDCLEGVSYLENDTKPDFETSLIQGAVDSGDSAILKKNFYLLVRSYLNLAVKLGEARNPAVLVVVFDDADENGQHLAKMTDQIRTFLTLPNLVVMMAADVDDLFGYIQLDKEKKKCPDSRAAARVMEKDYPVAHRVMVQDMREEILNNWKKLKISYEIEDEEEGCRKEILLQEDFADMAQQLQWFLFQKTGIVLTPDADERPLLLPTTMREISNLLKQLTGMKNITPTFEELKSSEDDILLECDLESLRDNVHRLRRYFIDEWAMFHLDREDHQILREIGEAGLNWMEGDVFERKVKNFLYGNENEGGGDAPNPLLAEKQANNILAAYQKRMEIVKNVGELPLKWKILLLYYAMTLQELYSLNDKIELLLKYIPTREFFSYAKEGSYVYDGFEVKDLGNDDINVQLRRYLSEESGKKIFAVWNYIRGTLYEPRQPIHWKAVLFNPVLWPEIRADYKRTLTEPGKNL